MIGLDVDGVLADFTRAFRSIAASMYGVKVHGSGAQAQWQFHDLTAEQDAAVWREIERRDQFWQNLDPVITPGEVDDLGALAAEGVRFVYVTARHDTAANGTYSWLCEYGLPEGEIVHAKDKVPYLSAVSGLRGFLDDSPHGVEHMHAAGLPVIVRDWPYNRHLGAHIPRVYSVGEYLAKVAA